MCWRHEPRQKIVVVTRGIHKDTNPVPNLHDNQSTTKCRKEIQNILRNFFDQLKFRFTVAYDTMYWQRLGKGIITGYTISIIVFLEAIKHPDKDHREGMQGPKDKWNSVKVAKGNHGHDCQRRPSQGARWILNKL